MSKSTKHLCNGCNEVKLYRNDQKTCGCLRRKTLGNTTRQTVEETGNSLVCSLPRTRIQTIEELIKQFKVDTTVWEVEKFTCNKMESASTPRATGTSNNWKRESANVVITPTFQVKAWFRRKVAAVAARVELAGIKESFYKYAPHIPRAPKNSTDNMLEINIPDLHLGKLAWSRETGWENYDTKIADAMYMDALDALTYRTSSYKFSKICYVVGNDLLNSDNRENTTTAGTPQSTDLRFQKTFSVARDMTIKAIIALNQVAPVHVVMVPGNHDTLTVWHLGDSLQSYFHNAKDIVIDNSPSLRKYYEFGRVMLAFTHGDKEKREKLPLIMAVEQSEMFGRTAFREIHCGHIHKTMVDEYNGVRVRTLPALCAPDAWHAEKGFVGNIRSAEAFVWNKQSGLLGTAVYIPPTNNANRVIVEP